MNDEKYIIFNFIRKQIYFRLKTLNLKLKNEYIIYLSSNKNKKNQSHGMDFKQI